MCHYINVAIGLLIRIELRVQLGSCSDAGRVDRQDIEKSRPRKYIRESNRRDAFGLAVRVVPGAQLREDPESPAVQYPLASS